MIVLILTEMTDTLPMIHEIKIMVLHFVETMRDLETTIKVMEVKITFNSPGTMEGLEIFKANRTILTSINLEIILKVMEVKITFNSPGKMEGLEIFKANRTIMISINVIIHELINNFR